VPIRFKIETANGNDLLKVNSAVSGDMHEKFLLTMPLQEICQNETKAKKVMKLIKDLFSILQTVKRTNNKAFYHRALIVCCDKWGQNFIDLFGYEMVTPYVHVFAAHLPEFYHKWMNLNTFSLEGVEKLNDLITSDYFRATNKKESFLQQILRKRLCQMLLTLPKRTRKDALLAMENVETDDLNMKEPESNDEDETVKYF
ncbi:unnamed protein product, partial [Didymodactylos carnosus]